MEGTKTKLETTNTARMEHPKRPSDNPSDTPIKAKSKMSPLDGFKELMGVKAASSLVADPVAQLISKKLESFTPPKYLDQLLDEYIKSKPEVALLNRSEQDMEANKSYDAKVKTGIKRTYEEHLNIYSLNKNYYCYKPSTNIISDDRFDQKGDSASHVRSFFPCPLAPSKFKKAAEPPNYLVAVGCRACYMYMMVAEGTKECPKCGGELIHFDKGKSPEKCPTNSMD